LLACSSFLSGQAPFPPGVEGEIYFCPRIDRNPPKDGGPLTIQLDGKLDEPAWKRAAFHGYTEYWKGGTLPTDEFDCDPRWAAVADENFLYVAWKIADEVLQSQSTGCGIFNDDAIEIYIDGMNDGGGAYGLDDIQLLVGTEQIGKDDPSLLEAGWVQSGGCVFAGTAVDAGGDPLLQGIVTKTDSNDGWQGEIAIALENIVTTDWHIKPTHGTTIGWDIHTDDDDVGGGQDASTSALIWSKLDGNSQAWHNPGVFGKLQFITPDKPLVSVSRDIGDNLQNGKSAKVTLKVTPQFGVGVVSIKEDLPPTLKPSNASPGGTINGNTVTWDLGAVSAEVTVSYTMTADPEAIDVRLPGTATIDGEPLAIVGDTIYTGSPINVMGFIKLWNHLGPLAFAFPSQNGDHGPPGACDANGGVDLPVDWIVDADETATESDLAPFPGLITKPKYGGTGLITDGTGARAAGLVLEAGDTGAVVQDVFPIWKGTVSPTDTIDHASSFVHGFDADDHVTLSCVYVTNNTGAAIATQLGIGSDDSIQVFVGDVEVGQVVSCRGWGAPNQEQDVFPVTLPQGESRILVKVADGVGQSGFRLRFQDPGDPAAPGLLPPDISLSLESKVNPPPVKVTRSFSKESFDLGDVIDTTLVVTARNAGAAVFLREVLPRGSSASDISENGARAGDAIEWNLTNVSTKTVSYKLTPATCLGELKFDQSTWRSGAVEAYLASSSLSRSAIEDGDLGEWNSLDIAYTGGAAQALGDHDVLVGALGNGIRKDRDEFRFIYIPMSGDFEISTKVDCLDDPARLGQGGLMVRDTLDEFSAHVFFGLSAIQPLAGGVGTLKAAYRTRTEAGLNSSASTIADRDVTSLPMYMKLKRAEGKISLERSADGVTYKSILTRTIGTHVILGNDTLVGLAVTGGGGGLSQFTFRDVSGPAFISKGVNFHRGDTDNNGQLQLTDAVRVLGFLFLGQAAPTCMEAADTDNNGQLQLTDAVRILGFLFLGQAAPAPPGPPPAPCGLDPAGSGDLGCETYTRC
jgi:hypothetical protein